MDEYTPTFSPKTRTAVYVTGLAVSFVSAVTAGVALAMGAPEVAGIAGLVGAAFGGVASGFGVGYRPTKS
jgi:hypothetical protein